MSIFAQHGFAKADKINLGISKGFLDGVILSPKNETPSNLEQYINELRSKFDSINILIDPEFHASTTSNARDGKLSHYPFYQNNITRANLSSPKNISKYVKETIDYQVKLPVSYIVSPTINVNSFQDRWSQISLSLAQESESYYATTKSTIPLLISFVLSENAFDSFDDLDEFLDVISLYKATGFYIIITRSNGSYTNQMDASKLQNLLYFYYSLAEINNFELILGFTDIIGLLFHAVGVKATACGWFNSLRQFSLSRYEPTTGGSAPRPRYTSNPLLNSIFIVPELDAIHKAKQINQVLSAGSFDLPLKTSPANTPWPQETSCLHHWESLNKLTQSINNLKINKKLDTILAMIINAKAIYAKLAKSGVAFDYNNGSTNLVQWETAITEFRKLVKI